MNMNIYSHICFYNNQSGEEKFDWFLVSRHYLPSLSRSGTKHRIPITQTSIVKQSCGNKEYVTGRSVDKWSTTNDLIAHFSVCIHLSISTYPPVGVLLSIFLSIYLSIYLSIKGFTKVRKHCHLHWIKSCTDAIKKTHPRPQNIWTGWYQLNYDSCHRGI